jgi:DNA-directed RNA polymerase subunit RPC12/RpoP
MSLSPRLRNLDLTLECKYCGHPKIKHGQWFVSVAKFKCEKCSREVGLPYRDKLALFKKHAHLIHPVTQQQAPSGSGGSPWLAAASKGGLG